MRSTHSRTAPPTMRVKQTIQTLNKTDLMKSWASAPTTAAGRNAEHADRDLPDAEKIDRQQREDGAELDQHREGLAEILVIEAEEALHQQEVSGGGHRQELGQPLDHAEDERLEKIERHDGS